jgi:L-alanine-DL-glutamate epimerase-like enolase superfamily enzyme
MPSVVVAIEEGGATGNAEAAGVYYLHDDVSHMAAQIERARDGIEQGADRAQLQKLLPSGGARNALDCALWEVESRRTGRPVWQIAGAPQPRPLVTTFTLPADDPARIRAKLANFPPLHAIKLKLDGDLAADTERVRTVRSVHPDTWLGVDANQGYDAVTIEPLVAMLADARVALLEQPNRRGEEAILDGLDSPIPIAADESILNGEELETHHARYDVINVKLDKCGGLTEALRMKDIARRMGKKLMIGNMAGGSLATAPAFVFAQFCDVVDLDGPWFLLHDPLIDALYRDGHVMMPPGFWGAA